MSVYHRRTQAAAPDRWLTVLNPSSQARVRLFCLPYAGGGANLFRSWPGLLSDFIEVCAFQLPGREARLLEPAYTDAEALVTQLTEVISPYLDKPAAFFGHSMGAILAFELARSLRRAGKPEPRHLFLSGRRAAQLPSRELPAFDLPAPEFIEKLRQLNGTPKEVFDHPELLELVLPLLRADFAVCQAYEYRPEPPLTCPITVLGGLEDQDVDPHSLDAWSAHTTSAFKKRLFDGDHFYVHHSSASICQLLSNQLLSNQLGRPA